MGATNFSGPVSSAGGFLGGLDGIVGANTPAAGTFTTLTATSFTPTGAIVLPAGTVSIPSLAFTGDLDTGLYSIGANSFGLTANGVLQATISTTGIQGAIGATTPAAGTFTTATATTFIGTVQANTSNGINTTRILLFNAKNSDGTVLTGSAAAGKFGISLTLGTSEALTGEAAQGNTKTDIAAFEMTLPAGYIAAQNLTVTVNAKYAGAGTAGTKTVVAAAYLLATDGTMGANLVATSAATITTSAADYAFVITGTTLTGGVRILVAITAVMQETGASSTLTATVNSARLS